MSVHSSITKASAADNVLACIAGPYEIKSLDYVHIRKHKHWGNYSQHRPFSPTEISTDVAPLTLNVTVLDFPSIISILIITDFGKRFANGCQN